MPYSLLWPRDFFSFFFFLNPKTMFILSECCVPMNFHVPMLGHDASFSQSSKHLERTTTEAGWAHFLFFFFSAFNCYLTVVSLLGKGAQPKYLPVLLCHIQWGFFLTFYVFRSCCVQDFHHENTCNPFTSKCSFLNLILFQTYCILTRCWVPVDFSRCRFKCE